MVKINLESNGKVLGGEFHLYHTDAPKSYDDFGTIEIHSDDGRYVLVNSIHDRWQVGRYLSGCYGCKEITDTSLLLWALDRIAERIWRSCEDED